MNSQSQLPLVDEESTSPFADLPADLKLKIACELDKVSIASLARVSSLFAFLNQENLLWKKQICDEFHPDEAALKKMQERLKSYKKAFEELHRQRRIEAKCKSYWVCEPSLFSEFKCDRENLHTLLAVINHDCDFLNQYFINFNKENMKFISEHYVNATTREEQLKNYKKYNTGGKFKIQIHPSLSLAMRNSVDKIIFCIEADMQLTKNLILTADKKQLLPVVKGIFNPNAKDSAKCIEVVYRNQKLYDKRSDNVKLVETRAIPDIASSTEETVSFKRKFKQ